MTAAYWKIPPMWAGRTVAVLASGPGLTASVAEEIRAAGVPAIVVNTSFRRAPWADLLYAADVPWWLHPEHRDAHAFAGLRVTIGTTPEAEGLRPGTVQVLRQAGVVGWSDAVDELYTLGNSGAQALQIAIKAGAARVLLAGFDFTRDFGAHWHGDHPAGLKVTEEHTFEQWIRRIEQVAPKMKARADIVTVTPSRLTCFRAGALSEELQHDRRDPPAAVDAVEHEGAAPD